MADDPVVLEMSTLPGRHPFISRSLRSTYVPQAIARLAIQPARIPASSRSRLVRFWCIPRPGGGTPTLRDYLVRWADIWNHELERTCYETLLTVPEVDVTEYAAILVTALVIHEAEGASVWKVLPLSTGADYVVYWGQAEPPTLARNESPPASSRRVEVGSVMCARWPSDVTGVVSVKVRRLLDYNPEGFVSVTAFSHPPDERALGFLYYVRGGEGNRVDIDPKGLATDASLDGNEAMTKGDTVRAREKHTEAARHLKRRAKAAIRGRERSFVLFLAATQFFKAGRYTMACKIASRVEARLLPTKSRDLLPRFRKTAKRRAAPGYAQNVRDVLSAHWRHEEYKPILDILKDHPYVLERSGLAYTRCGLCIELGQHLAAAAFFLRSIEYGLTSPALLVGPAMMSIGLMNRIGADAAWDAARTMAEYAPHVATTAAAAIYLFQRTLRHQEVERRTWAPPLYAYARDSLARLQASPDQHRDHPDYVELVGLALAGMAVTATILGDGDDAAWAMDEAQRLNLSAVLSRTLSDLRRGGTTAPAEAAVGALIADKLPPKRPDGPWVEVQSSRPPNLNPDQTLTQSAV